MATTNDGEPVLVNVTESGRKGGLARAKNMSKAERSDSARRAVLARWANAKKKTAKKKPTGGKPGG